MGTGTGSRSLPWAWVEGSPELNRRAAEGLGTPVWRLMEYLRPLNILAVDAVEAVRRERKYVLFKDGLRCDLSFLSCFVYLKPQRL